MKRLSLDGPYNIPPTFIGNQGMGLNSSKRLRNLYGGAVLNDASI